MKNLPLFLLLAGLGSSLSYSQENSLDVEGYIKKVEQHRIAQQDISVSLYEGVIEDYFLCPSSYTEQEMRAALFEWAKNPQGEFISPWQAHVKPLWEDGEEKPEYNLSLKEQKSMDGSQGRKLEDVLFKAKPEDIEDIQKALQEDVDYKNSFYIAKDDEILGEDFSAYYETASSKDNKGKTYRNLIVFYPENCDITILNKSRKNWRLDTLNHKINLRQLEKNKAEIEFYLPSKKQKSYENTAYEIIALDKKGRRLTLVYDEVIPLSVMRLFNKSGKLSEQAKANLIKAIEGDKAKLWEKGEYHLIKANGIIDSLYFKSFNELVQSRASIALDSLGAKENALIFLGENPYYAPNALTVEDVKLQIDVLLDEKTERYKIDLPAALNSFYAYVKEGETPAIFSEKGVINLPKIDEAQKTLSVFYPLEMDIRIFDNKEQKSYILSEDEKTLTFIPKDMELSANPQYYKGKGDLSYPYRIYDEDGHILKIVSVEHSIDKCGYDEAKSLRDEVAEELETISAKIENSETKILERETLIAINDEHKQEAENNLSAISADIKNKEEAHKALEKNMQKEEKTVDAVLKEIEKLKQTIKEIEEDSVEVDKLTTYPRIQIKEAQSALLPHLHALKKARREHTEISRLLRKNKKKEESLQKTVDTLTEKLAMLQNQLQEESEILKTVLAEQKKREEIYQEAQITLEKAEVEEETVCKVKITAAKEINWMETAFPRTYKEVKVKFLP